MKYSNMEHTNSDHSNPILTIILWFGQLVVSSVISLRIVFDLSDFRVWTLWGMSMLSGIVMLTINRKQLKKSIKEWRDEFKKKCN